MKEKFKYEIITSKKVFNNSYKRKFYDLFKKIILVLQYLSHGYS